MKTLTIKHPAFSFVQKAAIGLGVVTALYWLFITEQTSFLAALISAAILGIWANAISLVLLTALVSLWHSLQHRKINRGWFKHFLAGVNLARDL